MTRRLPLASAPTVKSSLFTVGLALALCLTGCGSTTPPAPPTGESGSAEYAPSSPATPAVVPDIPVQSTVITAPATAVPPTRLRIGAIGVDMPVAPVGVDPGGMMGLPVDPAVGGWYQFGPDATSTTGHVVISAHVDAPDYPIGPLARLRELGAGAEIIVDAENGASRTYVLESVTYYLKTDLPTGDLFNRDGAPALVLITCGGAFDSTTGRYRDNVVAIARPN